MRPDNLSPLPEPAHAADAPWLAISATFTAEPLEPALSFWMRELGWDWRVRFAPYNQVFQQLLHPGSLLARNRGGANAILVRFEDWARFEQRPSLDLLDENVGRFAESLPAAAAFPAPTLVCICPASPAFLAGGGRAGFLARMEERLRAAAGGLRTLQLITPADLALLYPVPEPHDPHGDALGRVPYTPAFFAALATAIARRLHAVRSLPYKAVAVDCDETLWAGICGEDGPEGVVVDPPRRALQEFLLERQREGLLLCLASKNNEEDVLETFRAHPEMPLRLEHFVARRINWESKAAGLEAMAADLGIGLDSFMFLDDNPKECDEVQANCPEVLALPLPAEAGEIPAFLRHVWPFDRSAVTAEDRGRTALYAQQAERNRLARHAATFEEFLSSLQLQVRIAPPRPDELARVAQLTRRTNQMNAMTVRRNEAEVRALLDAGWECLVAHVSDRFGSYGLTGAMLFRAAADALEVDTFLLSCRALGRGVEHRMLAALGELARSRGLAAVTVPFTPTARNRPALLFLEAAGAAFAAPRGEGCLFRFPAAHAAALTYNPALPPRPAPPPARGAAQANGGKAVDYIRIATRLRNPERILDEIRAQAGPAAAAACSAAPQTETERGLAAIWKELLRLERVGVHDSFFDLGGHSLLAVQLLSRVRQVFGADLSLEVVYSGELTIAELAKAIELKQIEQAGAGEYAALLQELEGLSEDEVRALLAGEESRGEAAG